ncbi:MAG: TonB-dependent receptor [Arachidicoccus sp.]|nr:TonB-dependent receptor [Arachidicoccus sp.]
MKISTLLKTILYLLLLVKSVFVFAYDEIPSGVIKGKITTSDGKPAAYISVSVDKLNKGAVTDENGEYIIKKVPVGTWTIRINSVGIASEKRTVTIQANETVEADFVIEENAQQLQEVVVNAQRQKINASEYAAKMPLKNIENSQVYSTISNQLISEQLLTSVDDAMRNVTGLQPMWTATARAGDGGSYYNSRGFTLQSKLRNGIAGIVTNTTDAANIESIEVLKGPSGALFGSVLTSYGGLINRVTKKPYENYGGEVSAMAGSYDFSRVTLDINTPLNNRKSVLFRLNTAYNYQGSFQTEGFSKRIFVAPSLLIKANDKLTFSFDAELSYGTSMMQPFFFFYFPAATLGITSADKIKNIDYKNAYTGSGLNQTARSGNYFAQAQYKISNSFTSITSISYSHSYSEGAGPYFYLIPDSAVTHNPADIGKSNYFVRESQSTLNNSYKNYLEVQQNFNALFNIGSLQNKFLFGLDYLHSRGHITYFDYGPFDIVKLGDPTFDYSAFNGTSLKNFINNVPASFSPYMDNASVNTYSAYASDVLNITKQLSVLAAVRLDHFSNLNHSTDAKYNQTVLSPKFGIVYQPVLDRVSLFANYQNSFSNLGTYNAVGDNGDIVSRNAKAEQANQWEAGVKTDLINNKLTATFSYYNIKVKNTLRTDLRKANTSIQDGTQVSRGVEFDINANPFTGFEAVAGVSYNDSKYEKADADVEGFRPTTASSPWLAHWWLSYQLPKNTTLKGLRIGFGGNYANDNKILNSVSMGKFILPSYIVLNAMISYEYKKIIFGFKADNLTNKHYWTGYTTMNAQMLRQLVASVSYKF